MGLLQHVLSSLSTGKERLDKEFELIGNCFGFYGLDGGVGTSTLAFEIANLAAAQGLHTCLIDTSPTSSFVFSKVSSFIKNPEDIPGLQKRFVKRTCPISDTLIPVNGTLRVMTFGDLPLIDTLQMQYDIIYETYCEAKETFDLVIMDIQNLPWCETTIAALKNCSTVYTICAPTQETIVKKARLDTLMGIAGLDHQFRNIVFGGVPQGLSVVGALGPALKGTVLGEFPYVTGFKRDNLSNYSVLNINKSPEIKAYSRFIDHIMTEIMEGISGKEVSE